jgi:membrane-associated phospholipid phosphatase
MRKASHNARVAGVVIAASMVAALALFFVLGVLGGFAGNNIGAWLNYYGHTLAGSLASFFYITILFFCLLVITLVTWSLGKSFIVEFFPKLGGAKNKKEARHDKIPLDFFLTAIKLSGEVALIIPAILFVTIVALAMGEANAFAPARLQDLCVIGWEHAFLGNYVFAALGAIQYPHWLIIFIIFSFENMSLILIGAGIILAYAAVEYFHELLVSFCVGILLMVPIWLTIPVLSPQDRFINNVYHLPDPPALAAAVANYRPQAEIANFLQSIRKEKSDLPALPTSTFPSAHVFWATITGYYLFRARRSWLLGNIIAWITLPFLVASTFGTVLLAQHYFMDVPAGIAIAAIAIWLADGIEKDFEPSA